MQETGPRKWLSLSYVARELGIGHETARQMAVTGTLKARRATGNPRGWWQVDPDDFARHKSEINGASRPDHTTDPGAALTPTAA